jgi:hypothetical protein
MHGTCIEIKNGLIRGKKLVGEIVGRKKFISIEFKGNPS